MPQPSQSKKQYNPALVLFLPAILVFDVVYYLYTRSSCFQCTNTTEFLKNSSLTVFTLSQTWQLIHKK